MRFLLSGQDSSRAASQPGLKQSARPGCEEKNGLSTLKTDRKRILNLQGLNKGRRVLLL
jgi:hypothetical protein